MTSGTSTAQAPTDGTSRTSDTSPTEVDRIVEEADAAGRRWARAGRSARAEVLRAVAAELDGAADTLVPIARQETRLPEARLRGELTRTTFQLRLFADTLDDGGHLDARVDHADPDWPMGAARPDLRRTHVPLGPTVVFAASNFPFAFSVAGGDTAAALAAGCPVVLKAHPGHLALSAATGAVVTDALTQAGAPSGLFAVIRGDEAGRRALTHPLVRAGAFTGSITGGRALFDLAAGRPEPIPFYGELGSVNPVFVSRAADQVRGEDVATAFAASFTLGAGQFCTKPGFLLVPSGSRVVDALRTAPLPGGAALLNERIAHGFRAGLRDLADRAGVEVLRGRIDADSDTDAPEPVILRTDVATVLADLDGLFVECFGPVTVVADYDDDAQLVEFARAIDGQLTATLVAEDADAVAADLTEVLADKAGRLLWNQWPTGVSVTYAQQHGGPYPATTAPGTTSVGTAAITRFLRPIAYQNFPAHLLPAELRDRPDTPLPRRVDGAPTS